MVVVARHKVSDEWITGLRFAQWKREANTGRYPCSSVYSSAHAVTDRFDSLSASTLLAVCAPFGTIHLFSLTQDMSLLRTALDTPAVDILMSAEGSGFLQISPLGVHSGDDRVVSNMTWSLTVRLKKFHPLMRSNLINALVAATSRHLVLHPDRDSLTVGL